MFKCSIYILHKICILGAHANSFACKKVCYENRKKDDKTMGYLQVDQGDVSTIRNY